MWDLVMVACSAVVGLAGAAMAVQGYRQRQVVEGRQKMAQGGTLILLIGSGVLPPDLRVVREACVIAGCLVMLASIVLGWRRKEPAPSGDA